ncbi:MAG: DNRLRE domain-containing protein [Actinobacteria bacterium]|nr:DNRLRE domain-containing protein [Actinomycetota bacterium]
MKHFTHKIRSTRGEREIARRRAGGEAGVTLIELMIALTIFAVVSSGVAIAMGSALGLTRNNRNRSVAANLAATEMDIVRSTKFESLPLTDVETKKTITDVEYTILRQTAWVSKDGTSGVCSPPEGTALAFLRVFVTVTWPDMAGVEPVESETILAPPIGAYNSDLGHLAVMVRDRDATPLDGVLVTAEGPGGTFTETTVEGCAFFVGLAPGQFDVSLSTTGFVDDQNDPNPTQPLVITAGSITSGEFVYDRNSTLNLSLVGIANYGVPNGIGARVANTGLALGDVPFSSTGGSGSSACSAPATTLYSSGDATVSQQYPTYTFGTPSQTIAGVNSSSGANARFLVRFDLPTAPAGCTVGTATLNVYDRGPSSSSRTIDAYQANASWSDTSVTWNNQPATTGLSVSASSPASAGWMSWGVGSLVQAQYAGSNNGFLLKDSVENDANQFNQFDVQELANDPTLVITWASTSACATPVTVGATNDARVRQSSGNSNYGSESTMRVRSQSSSRNERTFIKFNLPSDPDGCQFAGAELRLFQVSGDSGRTIRVYRSSASWSESSITWNNQPAATGSPISTPSFGSSSVWMTWDVTSLVNTMMSGSNDGFMLRDSSESSSSTREQVYRSSENSSSTPQLVLTYTDSPVLPLSQSVVAAPLFPYLNGYQAWGGTCHDADPQGVDPGTGIAYYPGAQREDAIVSNPNQTTTATVTLKSIDVRVQLTDGSPVDGATVVAFHDPDTGCTSGQTLNLGSTGSDGQVHVALPYGVWRFEVASRSPATSWPIAMLDPTTANPQTTTATVNP